MRLYLLVVNGEHRKMLYRDCRGIVFSYSLLRTSKLRVEGVEGRRRDLEAVQVGSFQASCDGLELELTVFGAGHL